MGSLAQQQEHYEFSFREFETVIERLLICEDLARNQGEEQVRSHRGGIHFGHVTRKIK